MAGLKSTVGRIFTRLGAHDVTGLAAMVAYNLAISLVPFSILALWIAGWVLDSPTAEDAVIRDLTAIFPAPTDGTLSTLFTRLQAGESAVGLISLAASIWTGMSFWGSLDTSFGRIYSLPSRGWVGQKRFSFAMLWLFLLLIIATVTVPVAQSAIATVEDELPFGLDSLPLTALISSLVVGVVLLFVTLWATYALAPHGRLPWRAVAPGALFASVAITALDYVYPLYLTEISNIWKFGTTVVFLVIVLAWFYVVALLILLGAELNAVLLDRQRRATVDAAADGAPGVPASVAPGTSDAEPAGAPVSR